jgi:protein TonB
LAPEGPVVAPYELVVVQSGPEAAPAGPPPVAPQPEPIGPPVQEPSPEAAPEPAPLSPAMAEPPMAPTVPQPLQPLVEPQPTPVPEPSPPREADREEEPAPLVPPAAIPPSATSAVRDSPKPTPRRLNKTQTRSPTRAVAANPLTSGAKGSVASSPDVTRPPAATTSPSVTSPSWLAGVNKWLLTHRSYPETARRLGEQGTAVVRFTVDREGHVLDVILVKGSGSSALDQAAQALVRDARLPPFPPDMVAPVQSITVPIHYRLE